MTNEETIRYYSKGDPDTSAPEEIARLKIKKNLSHEEVMELCRRFGCLTEDVKAAETLFKYKGVRR
jgi:hypothetical protein